MALNHLYCSELKGVGPRIAGFLKKLGITTVQDLLFHLPLRYEDRTHFKSLNTLTAGDHVQVVGDIVHSAIQPGARKNLLCRIQDNTGYLSLRFFHFNAAQLQMFSQIGARIQCFGEVRRGFLGYEMVHPEYDFLKDEAPRVITNKLTPVYPTTEGLKQYMLRKLTDQALMLLEKGAKLIDYLPPTILEQFAFPDLISAIQLVHRPPAQVSRQLLDQYLHPAQQRLSFEELLAHQLSLAKIRLRATALQAFKIENQGKLANLFINHLPYPLTHAQQRVIAEIIHDVRGNSPMLRLIQGDVGSGKTVVAAVAAFHAIESGLQVAIMVPTELLAEQHYRNFQQWCSYLDVRIEWLTSNVKGKRRKQLLQQLANGELQIIIGTHALFQSDIKFNNLGLIIIDEQHRFGVDQRLTLLEKGIWQTFYPHQLVMSATPIPRTLAMTAYADLDCSIIDELPPGRVPVKTSVLPNAKRAQLLLRVKANCLQGAQAYWVCTLIQESEVLQCQAAEELAKELTLNLPELRIGLVHGRMKSKEKESIMMTFKNRQIDLLIATTVIEVGVDVPNASLMIIENSERLGLAQLHQLRGRVGRGCRVSHCVLMYQQPLSKLARERLAVLKDSHDGFIIAQKDLDLRGPGEVLGTKQTGLLQLKIADLLRDQHQLPRVQQAAKTLLQHYPKSADLLIERWLSGRDRFSEV